MTKYLVYNSWSWFDGASEYDNLEEAEKKYQSELKNLHYEWKPSEEYYVAIAEIIKIKTAVDMEEKE